MSIKPTVVITTLITDWQRHLDEFLSTQPSVNSSKISELITLLLADVNIIPAKLISTEIAGVIGFNIIVAADTFSSLPSLDLFGDLTPQRIDHFLTAVFMIHRFNQIEKSLSVKSLILFHSKYKYLLMSYSQMGYRQSGKMIANAYQAENLLNFAMDYKDFLVKILSQLAKRGDQVNTLSHLQGYFKKSMTSIEKSQLTSIIAAYQQQQVSLMAPIELLVQLLAKYPNNYLSEQYYFLPYPSANEVRKLL